jgi:hypothetical protein
MVGAESAMSVGQAPVPHSVPPHTAHVISQVSHATVVAGMHNVFLAGTAVALAGAVIALLTRQG